ncbi:hypothetical protein JCM8097_001783 [Rhodosporidiobolus ruineniae]
MESILKDLLPSLPPIKTLQQEQSRRRNELDPLHFRHRVTLATMVVHWADLHLRECTSEPFRWKLAERLQEKEEALVQAQYAFEVELPELTALEDARVLLETELETVRGWKKLRGKVSWQRARVERAIEKRLVSKARSLVHCAGRTSVETVSLASPQPVRAVLDSLVLECEKAGLLEEDPIHAPRSQRRKAGPAHRRLSKNLLYSLLAPLTADSHRRAKMALAEASGTPYLPFVRADLDAVKRAEKQARADKRARRKLEKILRKKAILANVAKGVAISRTVSHACSLYL